MPATKKPLAVHFTRAILQWSGGKVQTADSYMNSVEMLTQLGVIKPADTSKAPKK